MSNWAAWKEKEIGLPVVKRAKHGIHFDAGKGLVRAEFVGKPCHYFDGKEYKAIDTRPLLRKDGTYGCAHSDVIIHTDGTVQVGDYTQRAALIYPGKVSVDGDRIARPFSGGVQYLYITEDGYRQEIVLEKMPDLTKVSALVDTVKGILPTKYTASSLSLKDSSTAELSDFVQVDKTSLASVLEAVKYPVTIDPDFSVTSGNSGDTSNNAGVGSTYNYGIYNQLLARGSSAWSLLRFILSSIASSCICTESILKLTGAANEAEDTYYVSKVTDANGDWIAGTQNGALALSGEPCYDAIKADGSGGVTTAWSTPKYDADLSDGNTETVSSATQYSFTLNSTGLTAVQGWFGDATNSGFHFRSTGTSTRQFHSGEATTAGYRPVLSVTYTAAGTFIPVNMMANTQNLTAGMRG